MVYVIVENAGYEGENILPRNYKSQFDAYRAAERKYGDGGLNEFNVAVGLLKDNGDITFDI